MKSTLVLLFTAIAIPLLALDVQPAPPVYVDLETVATALLPEKETDSVRKVSIEVETSCSSTNEFEVAFFSSETPRLEDCRLLVGLDRGKLFARGLRLDSEVSDEAVLPTGDVRISLSFSLHANGRTDSYVAKVNGQANEFLSSELSHLLPGADPISWRSVKVVSRGLTSQLPSIRFDDIAKGFVIRICKL